MTIISVRYTNVETSYTLPIQCYHTTGCGLNQQYTQATYPSPEHHYMRVENGTTLSHSNCDDTKTIL